MPSFTAWCSTLQLLWCVNTVNIVIFALWLLLARQYYKFYELAEWFFTVTNVFRVLNSKRRKWKVAVSGFNENTKTGNEKKVLSNWIGVWNLCTHLWRGSERNIQLISQDIMGQCFTRLNRFDNQLPLSSSITTSSYYYSPLLVHRSTAAGKLWPSL